MASNRDGADNGTLEQHISEETEVSGGPSEATQEKEINWHISPFYLDNFFTKQSDNFCARCNYCPKSASTVKTNANNTTVLDSHLKRNHRAVYDQFLIKKAEVKEKRKEIKEGFKREMGHDLFKT